MWVERKEDARKQLTTMLLSRLGLDKDALKQDNIKLKVLDTEKVKTALETLPGLDDDKIAELQNWIDGEGGHEATITDLIRQIGDNVMTPNVGDLPGQPAQLPQGEPQPKQPQQQLDPTQQQPFAPPLG